MDLPSEAETRDRALFVGSLLERLVATNSFFITAGYGSFFGLWAIVRDHLDPGLEVSAALCLLFSAMLFALWHALASTMMSLAILRVAIEGDGTAQRWRVAAAQAGAKLIRQAWMPVQLATVTLALAGIGTLAYGMLRFLLGG